VKIEKDHGWCVAVPSQDKSRLYIFMSGVARSRKEAQVKAIKHWSNGKLSWKQLYRRGYRAVRVILIVHGGYSS